MRVYAIQQVGFGSIVHKVFYKNKSAAEKLVKQFMKKGRDAIVIEIEVNEDV